VRKLLRENPKLAAVENYLQMADEESLIVWVKKQTRTADLINTLETLKGFVSGNSREKSISA
jgi:hypothetical protein